MLTYQGILRNELSIRRRKNPAYSIRSFARDLELSQSFLTQVLNRKRKLSDEKAILIAERLKLRAAQKKLFVSLVRIELARNPQTKEILRAEVDDHIRKHPTFALLSEDTFNIVADWYYFAILELSATKGFRNDPEWISRKLKVPVIDIKLAIDRLLRVGLLKDTNGKLKKVKKDYLFANVPSTAIRRHHQQTLGLANAALARQALERREFFTVSLPMDPARIARAKEMIREFSGRLMSEMQASEPKSVYKLAIQFFRLDEKNV